MKKVSVIIVTAAVILTMFSVADAQVALRAGGGMIFDGSQPGGHVSVILPFSSKPAGVMVSAEYYKKSGITTIPVAARGLYNLEAGKKADIYIGIGSGLIYSKTEVGTISVSSTKALFSGVGGLKINSSESVGFFGEVSLERALTSGAGNNLAGKVGIIFTLAE